MRITIWKNLHFLLFLNGFLWTFLYVLWINFEDFWDLLFDTHVKPFCTIGTFWAYFLGLSCRFWTCIFIKFKDIPSELWSGYLHLGSPFLTSSFHTSPHISDVHIIHTMCTIIVPVFKSTYCLFYYILICGYKPFWPTVFQHNTQRLTDRSYFQYFCCNYDKAFFTNFLINRNLAHWYIKLINQFILFLNLRTVLQLKAFSEEKNTLIFYYIIEIIIRISL